MSSGAKTIQVERVANGWIINIEWQDTRNRTELEVFTHQKMLLNRLNELTNDAYFEHTTDKIEI